MLIYLVRHAIALDSNPDGLDADSQRPLDPREVKRFRRAAEGLHAIAPHVDHLLTSPYLRATQTADLLTEHARWPASEICSPLAPGGGAAHIIREMARYEGSHAIAVVGHQPDLSELLSYLLTGSERGVSSEFRKGGVAALSLLNDHVTPSGACLDWLATPRMLRNLGAGRRS